MTVKTPQKLLRALKKCIFDIEANNHFRKQGVIFKD